MLKRSWSSRPSAAAALGLCLCLLPGASQAKDHGTASHRALDEAIARLEQGERTHERDVLRQAIEAFEHLVRQDANNARYAYYLGRAYFPLIDLYDEAGDPQAAAATGATGLAHARHAVRLDAGGNADAYRLLGDYYGRLSAYQNIFGRMRYGGRAIQFHDQALRLDPHNVMAVIGSGIDKLRAPASFGGDVHAAVMLFKQAIAMAPAQPLGHVWLARAYLEQGQHALALQHLEQALKLEPRSALVRSEYERAQRALGGAPSPRRPVSAGTRVRELQ